ncbi:MAG: hypothetical protein QOH10_523 [Actinomycetota bacterium]|nr:hypothetical protein [Actinomycetota bacterium]
MTELDDRLRRDFLEVHERVQRLPLPDITDRDPPGTDRRRLLAVVSAAFVVLLVAGVAVVAVHSQTGSRATTTTPPTTPRPSHHTAVVPAAGFLSLPYGGDKHTVTVWGWNGRRIATVHTAGIADCCTTVSLSPDGKRLLVLGVSDSSMPDGQVLDLRGRVLAQSHDLEGTWADDSVHLCEMRPHGNVRGFYDGPADLVLENPGHGSRVVAQVGSSGPHSGPVILSCSVANDQAIIGDTFTAQIVHTFAVQLSTGRVTTPTWAPSPESASIVAISGNGRYALELSHDSAGPRGQIVDTSIGKVVGTVDGQPTDISWNGHLVVQLVGGADLEVVDWRTHAVLWRSAHQTGQGPTLSTDAAVNARPHSDDLALDVRDVPGQPLGVGALWLVTPTQPPRKLAVRIVEGVS